MDSQDDAFRLTRDALKAKQKSLKKQGRGNHPNKTDAITDEEINILYEKKILGNETPESLLNTLWFNNSIHFGLRGVSEHYNLRWGDIKLKNSSDGTEYLEYNERQTKTRTGENIVDIRQIKPKMFATEMQEIQWKVINYMLLRDPMDFPRTMTLFISQNALFL